TTRSTATWAASSPCRTRTSRSPEPGTTRSTATWAASSPCRTRTSRSPEPGSVGPAEDDPLAVRGRMAAADAGPGLRLALQRDAAGGGRGRGLDRVVAFLVA